MSGWKTLKDPLALGKVCWPHMRFYDKEVELIRSVWHNDKTICVAGNKLGKDFTAAFIALTFFLTRSPCRIVTTSVDATQLESVLWGEIRDLIQKSKIALTSDKGGPLLYNHMHIRRVLANGEMCGLSYILGRVAKKGEGFLGHHIADVGDGIPRTLFIVDEASGAEDTSLDKVETWAKRQLYIGNAFECNNAFFRESEAGDKPDPDYQPTKEQPDRYYTKVIRITGHDSPNVKYAKAYEKVHGKPPKDLIIPGVLPYYEYKKWLATWDPIRISVSIEAQFYKGSELLLYPPTWLNGSHAADRLVRDNIKRRQAKAMGVDPGEGVAESAWCVIDDYGILETIAYPTPNTADIGKQTLALMKKWNLTPDQVMFDRGGGGTQIAGYLRDAGFYVQTVGFNEKVVPPPKRGQTTVKHQIENREENYAYTNRRVQMFWYLSELLDPSLPPKNGFAVFGIPDRELELRRQLCMIPKKYDKEGQAWLPPKNKRNPESKEKTLIEIIGCSPDRADALVVALYCKDFAPKRSQAGIA